MKPIAATTKSISQPAIIILMYMSPCDVAPSRCTASATYHRMQISSPIILFATPDVNVVWPCAAAVRLEVSGGIGCREATLLVWSMWISTSFVNRTNLLFWSMWISKSFVNRMNLLFGRCGFPSHSSTARICCFGRYRFPCHSSTG